LPQIDQVIDSTAGCDLLCFLDCYSWYHQIAIKEEDRGDHVHHPVWRLLLYDNVVQVEEHRRHLLASYPGLLQEAAQQER
jgi:hypothetical protein